MYKAPKLTFEELQAQTPLYIQLAKSSYLNKAADDVGDILTNGDTLIEILLSARAEATKKEAVIDYMKLVHKISGAYANPSD